MMKAKVKATGEIVNVYFRSPLWVNGDTKETYFPKELEEVWVEKKENPSKNIDYWTRLEHQYAGMAMHGILSNSEYLRSLMHTKYNDYRAHEVVPNVAVRLSHALVEKMKEEK